MKKLDLIPIEQIPPEYALFLLCHDRLVDLGCHLDIGLWTGLPTYVIFTGPTLPDHPEVKLGRFRQIDPNTWPYRKWPNQGSGYAFCEAIRWAGEIGIRKVIIRNADDWTLNRDFVWENLRREVDFQGYNWLSANADDEWAINENVLDVKKFAATVDIGWDYFRKDRLDVEHALGKWVKEIGASWHRLGLSRESDGGIGRYTDDHDHYDSSRWFNMRWGLFSHHDLRRKYERYQQLRHRFKDTMGMIDGIDGLEELENSPHERMKAWLWSYQ